MLVDKLFGMKNDNKMKLKSLLKKPISEATMHNMTRETALDKLKEVKHNILPYSKEAVKHIDAAISIIEKFENKYK